MKKYLLTISAALCTYFSNGQTPEDVLRYSYQPQHGSARSMAIGGAMGSLGGDINALYVNPAGLAFYRTSELVITPGFVFNKNKADYRGTNATANKKGFDLGTIGIVAGFKSPGSKWTNQTFSIGVNQVANFNNTVFYTGTNDRTSQSQVFADQFANSGLTIDQALNEPSFAYGTGPALYTYLVDTFRTSQGELLIKSLPEQLLEQGIALQQQRTIHTSGGIYEIALGYAANMDDKFYLGGSLGIPIVNYTRRSHYRESDPTGDTDNNFSYYQYDDTLSTKGFGVNLKLGAIFKPADYVRLGLTVHTPTFYTLTDRQSSGITTNSEGYTQYGTLNAYSRLLNGDMEGKTLYQSTTPWKVIMSGSYVFREVSDTRQQRGFISADIEYVGYRGSNFKADGETVTSEDQQYYKDLKEVINEYYKGAFNFRLGGELKFNTIMFRLGGAYYGNPYKQKELESNIIQASGGLGYRNHGMFIDLTYAHFFNKDVNFPYRLASNNTYAIQNNTRGNVVLTLGFKL